MSKGIKYKMYDYEVAPPPGAWKKIAEALDESDLAYEYPARLAGMEVTPPATAWQAIASQLEGVQEQVISQTKKRIPYLRYAAAAAIIAMLAWGGSRLLNNRSSQADVVATDQPPTTVPGTRPVQPTVIAPTKDVAIKDPVTDEARNDAALEASKKTYAKLNVPARSKIKNAAGFHFSLDNTEPLPPEDFDPATRYIVLMTPDGNIIRMSKKWSDLVCCVSGEEQDKECVDQMKKWRQKLASSSVAYSPGNFGDIMNLVKALQE